MPIERIQEIADRQFEQIWEAPKSSVPKLVYHYTNAEGLAGILNSKRIWATDCRFLNDETESQLGVRLAREILRGRLDSTRDDPLRRFYETADSYLDSEADDKNFVFSLSSRRDDLTQWRTYARDGRGFTIGFETSTLIENSKRKEDKYGFSPVIYDSEIQRLEVNKSLEIFEEIIKEKESRDSAIDDMVEESAVLFEWITVAQSILFKHSSFDSEKEWRINTFPDDEPESEVKVRASSGRLIPYIELKLCGEDQNCLPIKCIGIGPGFRDSGIKFAVDKLCEQAGFNVAIYNADTPYRRL